MADFKAKTLLSLIIMRPSQSSLLRPSPQVETPVKVILLIDAVNTDFSRMAYAREQAQKFL